MTAQSWRELAIEQIAKKLHDLIGPGRDSDVCEGCLSDATATVDALGDLAPTEVQDRVTGGHLYVEMNQRAYEPVTNVATYGVSRSVTTTVRHRRFVTAWQPIPDDQPVDLCAALQGSLDATKAEQAARDGEVTR